MNDQIEQYVTKLIGQIDTGVDASIDFLSSEIPLYIQELLLWYGVKSLVWSIFGLILLTTLTHFFVKHSGKGETSETSNDFKLTLTHNEHGNLDGHALLSFILYIFLSTVFISFMSLDWLQIWIAPRVWMLEYATSLTK